MALSCGARFPPAKEAAALEKIEAALAELDAGEQDIAFCQTAAGGDLLFLEACQRRGVRCQVLLPFEEPIVLQKSVLPSCDGERWRDRTRGARIHPRGPGCGCSVLLVLQQQAARRRPQGRVKPEVLRCLRSSITIVTHTTSASPPALARRINALEIAEDRGL